MTYGELKILSKSLLSSDFPLPEKDEEIKALLGMAYIYLMDKCQVLNLNTQDKSDKIHRLGRGTYLIRKPDMPTTDDEDLEIDDELGPVVASLIASYISEKRTAIHQSRADDGIRSYNAKVDELIERINSEGETP